MTAYLLVEMKLRDPSWLTGYKENVPAIMRRHGGERLVVSQSITRLEGDGPNPDGIALFTFPSMEAINAFLSDADYSPFKAARRAASSGDLLLSLEAIDQLQDRPRREGHVGRAVRWHWTGPSEGPPCGGLSSRFDFFE